MHLQKLQLDGQASLIARLLPCPISLLGMRVDQMLFERWRLLEGDQAPLIPAGHQKQGRKMH